MARFSATFHENDRFSASFGSSNNRFGAEFGQAQRVSTDDYEDLYHKPRINEVELIGNKTFRQLGLDFATVAEVESILYLD